MPLWVGLALLAAFLQNLRTALQKALTPRVGVLGATYARFIFAAPWALALAVLASGGNLPVPTAAFLLWVPVGALTQIAGTLLLLHVFSLRNFAVGNTFARTETVQAALFGLVLLGDRMGSFALAGILVSLVGLVLLSATRGFGGGLFNRAAGLGLLSGASFALSAVAYRGASLALVDDGSLLVRPAYTLACVTLLQSLVMTLWLRARAQGTVAAVLRAWRVAAPVGLAGMLASLLWFTAFTLTSAAQVKAVGQVELLFSWLTARFAFGERPTARETIGIALVASGIVAVVLAG
jgi:drug/metabolite transporter (DMT)-like permease